MDDFATRPKKRPVTYGRAARRHGNGRQALIESEDELAQPSKTITVKPSKSLVHKETMKIVPVLRNTTPPSSRSPSIASPSSTRNKRSSPFADDAVGEQKRKVRVVSQGSTRASSADVSEGIFPAMAPRKRKPVPKLTSKDHVVDDVTQKTQMLLDNQLQEPSPPPLHMEKPVPTKKASLKMPTRTRAIATTQVNINTGPAQSNGRDVNPKLEKMVRPLQPLKSPAKIGSTASKLASSRRPDVKSGLRTPGKSNVVRLASPILSPSKLDLDELNLSIKRNVNDKSNTKSTSLPIPYVSPKASPNKPKLKDRLTSDLEGMVMDLDTTLEISITLDNDRSIANQKTSASTNEISGQQDTQKSLAYTQSSQSQGPKVTYGATRWTFLPDEDEDAALFDPIADDEGGRDIDKRSRKLPNLIKSSGKTDAFEMDDDDEEPTSTMRSLHELKRAGGSQRVSRQAEALIDDVEHSRGKAQRLTTLLELVSKLRQSAFLRQFLDAGQEIRLLNIADMKFDSISKVLYSIALLLVLDGAKLSIWAMENDLLEISTFLAGLLENNSDLVTIAKARNNHVPKDVQKEIEQLCGSLRLSKTWTDDRPSILTPRIVALTCLERLTRTMRGSGYEGELVSVHILHELMNILTGWPCENDKDDTLAIWLTLSTLESASLAYRFSENQSAQSWNTDLGAKLTSFYTGLRRSESTSKYDELISLSLRLCLNLSNGDAGNCDIFSNIQFIGSILETIKSLFNQLADDSESDIKQDMILDNLVLSLGLLINLSEKDEQTRDIFLQGEKMGDTALEVLIQLFLSRVQQVFEVTSIKEARSNVPFGYLAVLLGYLCKNASIFARVRSRLKGGNLRVLLIAIGEFLQYHQKVEELRQNDVEAAVQEQDIKTTYIARLQGLLTELQSKDDLAMPSVGKRVKGTHDE